MGIGRIMGQALGRIAGVGCGESHGNPSEKGVALDQTHLSPVLETLMKATGPFLRKNAHTYIKLSF